MIYTYFPLLRIAKGEIRKGEDKSKDILLEKEEKLKVLFGLYEKSSKEPQKETLKESEKYSQIMELQKQLGFTGGDAIPSEILQEYANTMKEGFLGCFEDWANLIKECPGLGLQPGNLTSARTLRGVLNIIEKNLEELRNIKKVDKDDPKPVQLALTLERNTKTASDIIHKILELNFQKPSEELREMKTKDTRDSYEDLLEDLGYRKILYDSIVEKFSARRKATEEEIEEMKK